MLSKLGQDRECRELPVLVFGLRLTRCMVDMRVIGRVSGHQPSEEAIDDIDPSRRLGHWLSARGGVGYRGRRGLGRVVVPELRMVVPAVVVEFCLPVETQFALGALVDRHLSTPVTRGTRTGD